MKERAGKKKVVLGGNASVIVDRSANIDSAVKRILLGAFAHSGQVCISVQRIFVHADVMETFLDKFITGARGPKLGDPLDPATDIGPMVDEKAAQRTQERVDEAVAVGGLVLLGGTADGSFFGPTVPMDTPVQAKVCSNEAFAPLVVVFPFTDLRDAVAEANRSYFGLQAGIFTDDLANAVRVQ